MNLNNFLKVSAYFMVFFWFIASYTILLFEFGEILDHDVADPDVVLYPNWYCAVWPLVGSKQKCLDISWYAFELTSAIINCIFLVLLILGMVKRKYILMVPWIIFRFTSMLVSWSPFKLHTMNLLRCSTTINYASICKTTTLYPQIVSALE